MAATPRSVFRNPHKWTKEQKLVFPPPCFILFLSLKKHRRSMSIYLFLRETPQTMRRPPVRYSFKDILSSQTKLLVLSHQKKLSILKKLFFQKKKNRKITLKVKLSENVQRKGTILTHRVVVSHLKWVVVD